VCSSDLIEEELGGAAVFSGKKAFYSTKEGKGT
jgi:hypothetical protein